MEAADDVMEEMGVDRDLRDAIRPLVAAFHNTSVAMTNNQEEFTFRARKFRVLIWYSGQWYRLRCQHSDSRRYLNVAGARITNYKRQQFDEWVERVLAQLSAEN